MFLEKNKIAWVLSVLVTMCLITVAILSTLTGKTKLIKYGTKCCMHFMIRDVLTLGRGIYFVFRQI